MHIMLRTSVAYICRNTSIMRYFLLLLSFTVNIAFAQKLSFTVMPLSLPSELSYYDNQFSGLFIEGKSLYMLSESRLQDKAEPKIYAVDLEDLDKKIKDSSYVLPFKKYRLLNLELLRAKMLAAGQDYEGLEAMVIHGRDIFLSVETATPSSNCYLLKGRIDESNIIMDADYLVAMPKPVNKDGSHIYNAGFEALAQQKGSVYAFFEYNYFPGGNFIKLISGKTHTTTDIEFQKLPFRITDITQTGKKHYTAINYFYKGEGDDSVYRTPPSEKVNQMLIREGSGYRSYCRLIDIRPDGYMFTWKPLWVFPEEYMQYNWEGIAAHRDGYFIINDKYTPSKPYKSTLLYLQKNK